ncbi:hypothetical protein SAMN02799622_05345 [Methylobacterium sp. UNC378MF]|uniref:hypothetical protein n=1 Tax=Methylobacterium sp. UNC378MF TaxID=1502748 RepID=UPI00088A5415|nr:hypothetical protein [Methylobacterium sp. UNC378MF]SDA32877.1 hypothetical protein SAMN02799622_05345 [Methylobacterium sp. UNC378MF]
MTVTPTLMDEAVQRINCYAVGAWLERLLTAAGQPLPAAAGPTPGIALPRVSGLVFRIGSVPAQPSLSDSRDLFHLITIEGNGTAPMPLGLDAAAETISSASAKLSQSVVGGSSAELASGDRRISFFMSGGRVIELRFGPSLVGFDRILIARLGEPWDWRDPSSR